MILIIIGMQFITQIEFDVQHRQGKCRDRTGFILHAVVQGVIESMQVTLNEKVNSKYEK